jgi:hypothetical protein
MAKTLDFTTRKKEYLTVKLNDEKKTVLLIGTPTKKILEEFISINDRITEDEGADKEAVNDLYRVCARVMSFNKGGIKITAEDLGEFFDLEDVMTFFNAYSDFMASVTNAKN